MAVDCLISIGGKVVELLVAPLGRRLMYIIHPDRNIPKLNIQLEKLEALRKGVQESIDPAIRNGQVIRADVKMWTEKVDNLIKEAESFPKGGSNANSTCFSRFIPDPAAWYKKGKRAEEKTMEVDELLKEGNFTSVSNPAPPLGIEAMPSGSADMTYKATTSAKMKVLEALRDDGINFIGIHGIGGVGKTTLVKDIGKKVKEDKLFDKVVMAVVSQNQDIRKIQSEIAGWMGLNLTDEPTILRATKLCARIKEVATILVILDDVWANLDLVAVGIPFDNDHQGCKIIITTRREQVCRFIGTVRRRKIIALKVLSKEDSWHLFKSKAGSVVDSPKLIDVAKDVWRECGHLPLALVTVGSAMSCKYGLDDWKEAYQQLKIAAPHDIEGVEENVYRSIKLSFDFLKDGATKNLFLLCSLFPEDHDIPIEDLVRYAWGLMMFNGATYTVQGARRRVKSVINNLKDASLLVPSDMGERWTKMHDVVRDVAISIGSDKYIISAAFGGGSLKNWPIMEKTMGQYEGISLMGDEGGNYPVAWDFPNLKILLLAGKQIGSSLCSHYLLNLKKLNVLYLNPIYPIYYYARPSMVLRYGHYDFSQQTCLRILILRGIDGPDIAAIGKIITLEILDLRGCRFHEAPHAYVRALTNLRVLDLRGTFQNYVVKDRSLDNILSPHHLTHLEELYVVDILSWDEYNTLKKLPCMKVLQACLRRIQTMPRDFVFPDQLDSFFIVLGRAHKNVFQDFLFPTLVLEGIKEPPCLWKGSITPLLTKCNVLAIRGCHNVVSIWPDLTARADDLKLLTHLHVAICGELRYIVNTTDQDLKPPPHQQLLTSLEDLFLHRLRRLEYLFKLSTATTPHPHHHVVYLSNLKRVSVGHCSSLKYMFDPSISQTLVQLEQLEVHDCSQLEEIVADGQREEEEIDDEKKNIEVVLKNLNIVTLYNLPNFRGFCCMGDIHFDWPSLEGLSVNRCPKMSTFTATTTSTSTSRSQSTPKLKSVEIDGCSEIIPQGRIDLNEFLQNRHSHEAAQETQQE